MNSKRKSLNKNVDNHTKKYLKLATFRELVKQHDNGWLNIANNLFWGENEEISRLKNFLKEFDHLSGDYEFTLSESFQLIWLLKSSSDAKLLQSLKDELHKFLGSDNIQLIEILDRCKTLDEDNFLRIFLYPHDKKMS